jgi:Protein of unknown function (DUF2844)
MFSYWPVPCSGLDRARASISSAPTGRALIYAQVFAFMYKALVLLSTLTAAALPGWAALGGSAESVATDQVKFQARRAVMETRAYAVHEISRDDGTLIREYVTPAGKVFGVSWSGPVLPDLSQLLGSYNTEFQDAVRAKRIGRGAVVVHNPDLVVESTGHMRAFYGRAYLESMLPSGVTQEIVK